MPISLICQNCGKSYRRKPKLAPQSKACSKQCLGVIQRTEHKGKLFAPHSPILWKPGAENPRWKNGEYSYRKHKRKACERCGSKRHLLVHHKDEDRANNDLVNLETLCKSCHQGHHCVRDSHTGRYVPQ